MIFTHHLPRHKTIIMELCRLWMADENSTAVAMFRMDSTAVRCSNKRVRGGFEGQVGGGVWDGLVLVWRWKGGYYYCRSLSIKLIAVAAEK